VKCETAVTRGPYPQQAAARAHQATARGEAAGPLHGLPVTIKDAIATAGIRSTGGAAELAAACSRRPAWPR